MSVLRDAIWKAQDALRIPRGGGMQAEHARMVEGIRAASQALRDGEADRFHEAYQSQTRDAYETARRERDRAEKSLQDAQMAMTKAWFDLRDALDGMDKETA